MTKEQFQKDIAQRVKTRRVLKREVKEAQKTLENLLAEQEDNESCIEDARDCVKNGLHD